MSRAKVHVLEAVMAVLLSAGLPVGCGWNMPDKTPSREPVISGDDEFAAGANRPPTVRTLYAMARMLAAQGKDVQAEAAFRSILRDHPEFVPAYADLAELLVRQERIGEAVRTLELALRIAPDDAVLLNDIGMCRFIEQDYPEALNLFTRAAATDLPNARYRANMAAALGMMGRYEESLALYEQVVPLHEAHHNLAVLCEARRDSARAAREYEIARELKSQYEQPERPSEPRGEQPPE